MMGSWIIFLFLLTWSGTLCHGQNLSLEDCESSNPLICGSTNSGGDKIAVCLAKENSKGHILHTKTKCLSPNTVLGKKLSVHNCRCCEEEKGARPSPGYCPNQEPPTQEPTTLPPSSSTMSPVDNPLSIGDCESYNPKVVCGTTSWGPDKYAVCFSKTNSKGVARYRTKCVNPNKVISGKTSVHNCGCCEEESGGKKTPGYCQPASTPNYCACPTCTQDVWDSLADQFSCGARIEWLQSSYGITEKEACMKVAGREFPIPCGPCNTFICDPQTQRILPEPDDIMTLVWSDEFDQEDGTAPDSTKWKYDIGGNGWGNFEQQYYTDDLQNAFVQDGILHIRAAAATSNGNYNNDYTSARLVSKGQGDFLYGRFRVRVRLSDCTAVGTWPAVWMLPTDNLYGIWPLSGEIDIMEHVGYNAGAIHGSLHTQSYNGMIGTQKTSGIHLTDDPNDWHVYDVMWTPDRIEFAVDNLVFHEYTRPDDFTFAEWPFDQRFHLLMNVAVGGSWGGKEGVDADAFEGDGQVLEIDWVRVYQF